MGDTFSSFVKFISDDPIMLGLCIAIIFLVILFIIVLFVGRKKDQKSKIDDNTAELLKTEVNLDALESTKQYSLTELQGTKDKSEPSPVLEKFTAAEESLDAKNDIPVLETDNNSMESQVNPQSQVHETVKPATVEIPVETLSTPKPLEFEPSKPTIEWNTVNENYNLNDLTNSNINSTNVSKESNKPESVAKQTFTEQDRINDTLGDSPSINNTPIKEIENNFNSKEQPTFENQIIESKVNPITENDFQGADSLVDLSIQEQSKVDDQSNPFFNFSNQIAEDPTPKVETITPPIETLNFDYGFDFNADENSNIFDKEPTINEPAVPSMENFSSTAKVPKVEIPTMTSNNAEPQKYNSVYMNNDDIELPEMNFSFDKSKIMNSFGLNTNENVSSNETSIAPALATVEEVKNVVPSSEANDDLDLPKLNSSSTFKNIQGESFDI